MTPGRGQVQQLRHVVTPAINYTLRSLRWCTRIFSLTAKPINPTAAELLSLKKTFEELFKNISGGSWSSVMLKEY